MYIRSPGCESLCGDSSCSSSSKQETSFSKQKEKSKVQPPAPPLKDKATLSRSCKLRLVATVQRQRIVSKELENRVSQLKKEISKNSISVEETLVKDILTILADASDEVTPHMRVFWEQHGNFLHRQSLEKGITRILSDFAFPFMRNHQQHIEK